MTKPLRLTQVERKEISDTKMLEVAIDLIIERGTANKTTKGMNRASTFTRSRECFLYASETFSNLSDAFDSLLYD